MLLPVEMAKKPKKLQVVDLMRTRSAASDLGLHCFLRPVCPNILSKCVILSVKFLVTFFSLDHAEMLEVSQ